MGTPFSKDDLEDAAREAKEDIEYVRRQITRCLDELDDPDADLDEVLDQYNALATKLKDAADTLRDATDALGE